MRDYEAEIKSLKKDCYKMKALLRREQISLWFELSEHVSKAVDKVWSMRCGDTLSRIVSNAEIVGWVEPANVPLEIICGGIYDIVSGVDTEKLQKILSDCLNGDSFHDIESTKNCVKDELSVIKYLNSYGYKRQ